MEEEIDLVTIRDEIVGSPMLRSFVYDRLAKGTWIPDLFFRCVVGIAENQHGEVLLLERRQDKRVLPGAWDYSVRGQVKSGESYEQAFLREASEELLGLDTNKLQYGLIAMLPPLPTQRIFWHTALYHIVLDHTPDFNPDDFVQANWTKRDTLLQAVTECPGPPKFCSGIREILKVLFRTT
jgi:isopentenyldiphosphate isomerase